MGDYLMPSLGADMEEGTLVEWLVAPGDTVHRGQVVAVVDTSKSAIEVEVFEDGVVGEILVPTGTKVPVGTPLARIVTGDAPRTDSPVPPAATSPAGPAVPSPPKSAVPSPVVRHHAHELGVDLASVHGSGPDGTPTRRDVDLAAQAERRPRISPYARRLARERGIDPATVPAPAGGVVHAADLGAVPAPPERTPAEAMREAIGQLMARSKREIPHYYLQTTIDLGPAMAWLTERNVGRPPADRLIPAALLLKAAALAARVVPDLNGVFLDGAFRPSDRVHLGVAVALRGGGLIAPALHDADTLALDDLMAALKDLVTRARGGRLRGSEMSDPTITVTNLGDQGAEAVHGVIYPPQVALVGFGRIVDRPWVVEDSVSIRPVTVATLAADHRVTDGRLGSRYLSALEARLAEPESL